MKKFKIADTWISVVLILSFTLISLTEQNMNDVFTGYFVIGSWQLISMVTHFVNHWFIGKGSKRIIYHRVVIGILILAAIGLAFIPLLYVLLFLLLFTAPLLALYYTWICYYELHIKMQRPLNLLK